MAFPTAQLTVADITKAQTAVAGGAQQRVELRDGAVPGLRLRIGRRAAKWDLIVEVKGARVTFPLGNFPTVSLAQARTLARAKRDVVAEIGMVADVGADTLRELLEVYAEGKGRRQKNWPKTKQVIIGVFEPVLDARLIKLERLHVQQIIDRYPKASVSAYATRLLRPVLKWARKRGLLTFNPAELEQPDENKEPRSRVLSDEELASVLGALGSGPYDIAVRLLLLTACRRSEVADAEWSEFDFEKKLWTLPRARTKTAQERVIPLTDEMIDLLKMVPRTGPMVFGRLLNWHRYQQELYARTGTQGWHRHDLRRTSATVLGRLGYFPHVIEAVLGHKAIYSRLAATYNHCRYEGEQREALGALSKFYGELSHRWV